MILKESKKYLTENKTTITTVFLLPFIFRDKTILSKKNGFINAFIGDINRPYMYDKVCVVFLTSIPKKVICSLENNKYFYNSYYLAISNVHYKVFTYIIPKELDDVKYCIEHDCFPFRSFKPFEYRIKILKFWNNLNMPYIKVLLDDKEMFEADVGYKLKEIIPEQDPYKPTVNDKNSDYFYRQLYRRI